MDNFNITVVLRERNSVKLQVTKVASALTISQSSHAKTNSPYFAVLSQRGCKRKLSQRH